MTITEYAELAQRTASTKTREEKVGHGKLGLIGEAGEIVDIVKKMEYMGMTSDIAYQKLIEESGDFWWYIVEICEGLNVSLENKLETVLNYRPIKGEKPRTLIDLSIELAHLSSGLAWFIKDKDARGRYIMRIIECILRITSCIGVDKEDVWQHNIDKLKKRYPDGFSADRSNRRYE